MNERSSDSMTSVLSVAPALFVAEMTYSTAESHVTDYVVADSSVRSIEPTESIEPTANDRIQTTESLKSSESIRSPVLLESLETQTLAEVASSEKSVPVDDSLQSWLLFSLFLGCGAVVMFLSVWRTWKQQQRTCDQKKELHYYQGVFLRRIQSAAMLALIAILLPLGPVFFLKSLVGKIVFLLAILLLIFWMVALTLADVLIARLHWQRLQDQCKLERLKLELAIRQQHTTAAKQTVSDEPSDSNQPPRDSIKSSDSD